MVIEFGKREGGNHFGQAPSAGFFKRQHQVYQSCFPVPSLSLCSQARYKQHCTNGNQSQNPSSPNQQSPRAWSCRARLSVRGKELTHGKKWHFWDVIPCKKWDTNILSTVQKKWKKRLKKKHEIEVQSQLLQMETHQTTFFCTSKQIPVISEFSLSIPLKGSGIPGYRDFYPIKETETFFSLTWEHIQCHLCNR